MKFSVVIGNRYLPRGSKENVLSTTITGNNYVQIGNASSDYTMFGFCHDSLNSPNSVIFI